jgi:hypothetical protein
MATMRFDHHELPRRRQERGIMYVSIRLPMLGRAALEACLAESFHDTRMIDPGDRDPWLVSFSSTRALTFLDVTSAWTTYANGTQAICSGRRDRAREWARAIYDDYPNIDGIHYTPAHYGPGHSVALFERARDAIPPNPHFHRPLSSPGLRGVLDNIANILGYGLT